MYNLDYKGLTAEHATDRQLIMCPNCNISLKWKAHGWVHVKLVMLQPGAHSATKIYKQVRMQIEETVKYCNELYQSSS